MFLLFLDSSSKIKWQLWYVDLPTQLLVSLIGIKHVFLAWTHESSNFCTARKSSNGHVKSTARGCSVFWEVHVVVRDENHESSFVLCPYSPSTGGKNNQVTSSAHLLCVWPVWSISFSPNHRGEQGCAQWSGCITLFACVAFSVVVVFPTLSKNTFSWQ